MVRNHAPARRNRQDHVERGEAGRLLRLHRDALVLKYSAMVPDVAGCTGGVVAAAAAVGATEVCGTPLAGAASVDGRKRGGRLRSGVAGGRAAASGVTVTVWSRSPAPVPGERGNRLGRRVGAGESDDGRRSGRKTTNNHPPVTGFSVHRRVFLVRSVGSPGRSRPTSNLT